MVSAIAGAEEDLVTVSTVDRKGKPLRTVLDTRTGIVRNDPIPGDAELAEWYAKDYRLEYKSAARPRPRQILRNFRRARDLWLRYADVFEPARDVLDAGAGSGEFLHIAASRGKSAKGVEPNREYAAYCREELGLDVTTDHLDEGLFAPDSFDLISLSHVLEHLNDPVRYLSMLRGWLRPGGVLYVEVPDIDVMCGYHNRGNMFHYGHIWNFSPTTLRNVAALAGLEEDPRTADRSKATTSVVLRRAGATPAALPDAPDAAARTRALIDRHYATPLKAWTLAKPFVKARNHLEEERTAKRLGAPDRIGAAIAADLARRLVD